MIREVLLEKVKVIVGSGLVRLGFLIIGETSIGKKDSEPKPFHIEDEDDDESIAQPAVTLNETAQGMVADGVSAAKARKKKEVEKPLAGSIADRIARGAL